MKRGIYEGNWIDIWMQQTRALLALFVCIYIYKCVCVCVCVYVVEDVTSRNEEQNNYLVNNKRRWFTHAAVGIDVWHFAYKIIYHDWLKKG